MKLPMKLLQVLKSIARDRTGTSAIELGLCLPLVAGMIIPLTDLGMGAYTQMQVTNAAQAGAEFAAANGFNGTNITTVVANATSLGGAVTATPSPSQSCSCVSGAVISAAAPAGGPPCTQTCPSGTVGTFVTVSAQASYTPLFNYPGIGSPLTLTSQAVIRIK
jgi:Flp pilus assembly protein TadG